MIELTQGNIFQTLADARSIFRSANEATRKEAEEALPATLMTEAGGYEAASEAIRAKLQEATGIEVRLIPQY